MHSAYNCSETIKNESSFIYTINHSNYKVYIFSTEFMEFLKQNINKSIHMRIKTNTYLLRISTKLVAKE